MPENRNTITWRRRPPQGRALRRRLSLPLVYFWPFNIVLVLLAALLSTLLSLGPALAGRQLTGSGSFGRHALCVRLHGLPETGWETGTKSCGDDSFFGYDICDCDTGRSRNAVAEHEKDEENFFDHLPWRTSQRSRRASLLLIDRRLEAAFLSSGSQSVLSPHDRLPTYGQSKVGLPFLQSHMNSARSVGKVWLLAGWDRCLAAGSDVAAHARAQCAPPADTRASDWSYPSFSSSVFPPHQSCLARRR